MNDKVILKYLHKALRDEKSRLFWIVNDILAVLILISVISIFIESLELAPENWQPLLNIFEIIIIVIFTVEYIAEIIISKPKAKYIFSFFGIIDLLSILPSYLLMFDFRFIKVLRIVRILRFLRLLRLAKLTKLATSHGSKRLKTAKQIITLNLIIYFTSMGVLVTIMGTILYELEGNVPGTTIHSVLDGMWLAISTITTVTFGDVFPITAGGKSVVVFGMLAEIALLGLMIVIVGHTVEKLLFGTVADFETEVEILKQAHKDNIDN
ncbi:MAG: ion transporter [bacterium]|nr:ion transporter [bacterium]